MKPSKQRATNETEKQMRRQAIIAAAHTLAQKNILSGISMSNIAEQAGLAKGTLYLYFETKEEVFLALTQDLLNNWFDILDESLRQTPKHSARSLALIIAASLNQNPLLMQLLGMLHGELEVKSSYQAVLAFKQFLATRLPITGQLIEQTLPTLPMHMGMPTLLQLYALAIGIQQMNLQSETLQKVIENHPLLDMSGGGFKQAFAQAAETLLRGVQ